MPEVFVPMTMEDAISWEIGMVFVTILAVIFITILVGLTIALIGTLVLVFVAIYHLIKRNYVLAIASLLAWVICVMIAVSVYESCGRPRIYKNQVSKEIYVPFWEGSSISGAPNKTKVILKMKNGQVLFADSLDAASRGNRQIITYEEIRDIREKSVRSLIKGHIQSQYCSPIDREFIDCSLSSDMKVLAVYVNRKWRNYPEIERQNSLSIFYRNLESSLGSSPPEGVITVKVYDTKNHLFGKIHSRSDALYLTEFSLY